MRIEEKHAFLGDFIKGVASGQYGIAAFQRPFVWTKEDVEDFMASIQKGYPIGSFFMWTPTSSSDFNSRGRIGPIEQHNQADTLILDGQNRLTTLAWAARSSIAPANPAAPYSPKEKAVFLSGEVLVADAEEQRLHFVPSEASWEKRRMPLSQVLAYGFGRSREVFDAIKDHGVQDSDLNWLLDRVPSWFLHKKLVVTEMMNATPEEAISAFLSICKAGQPITEIDYQNALEWAGIHDRSPSP